MKTSNIQPNICSGHADEVNETIETLELFEDLPFRPIAVPYVCESDRDLDDNDGLIRPKRRFRVRANRSLYANAKTMTRS